MLKQDVTTTRKSLGTKFLEFPKNNYVFMRACSE